MRPNYAFGWSRTDLRTRPISSELVYWADLQLTYVLDRLMGDIFPSNRITFSLCNGHTTTFPPDSASSTTFHHHRVTELRTRGDRYKTSIILRRGGRHFRREKKREREILLSIWQRGRVATSVHFGFPFLQEQILMRWIRVSWYQTLKNCLEFYSIHFIFSIRLMKLKLILKRLIFLKLILWNTTY